MGKRKVKTAEEVRKDFLYCGASIAGWARSHGFSPNQVVSVLNGRNKGNRGKAHNIAVLLGIKDGDISRLVPAPPSNHTP